MIGHPEYDKYTLDAEYKRDVAAGRDIRVPVNYYPDDDPGREPLFRWRAHGYLLLRQLAELLRLPEHAL